MVWRRRLTGSSASNTSRTSNDGCHAQRTDDSNGRKITIKTSSATAVVALSLYSLVLTVVVIWLHARPASRHLVRADTHPRNTPERSRRVDVAPADQLLLVDANGSFMQRVREFNVFIDRLRRDNLTAVLLQPWQPINKIQWLLLGSDDDYLERLTTDYHATTVALPWLTSTTASGTTTSWTSLNDTANVLLQAYHEWTADHTLCSCIERRPYRIGNSYDVVYNRTCHRNISDTAAPMSLRPVFLNGKPIIYHHYWPLNGTSYPPWFYTDTPPYAFFMHIHRHAVITQHGDIISGNLKLVLYDCNENMKPVTEVDNEAPLYDEVFVIAQYWGEKVFHRMVEVVPRLALYTKFLNNNPQIRIFASEKGQRLAELLAILELNPARLVTGEAVRAKIVYQPRITGCGSANVHESQMLSRLYHNYLQWSSPPQPRNRLVLIRRSGLRRFTEQEEIERLVERAARDYDLVFTMFDDDPVPSLRATMLLFHSAVMVVGPHGAGFSNIYFSQRGTYVVEGVCEVRLVNLCHQWLSHILGHHWHGVTSRGGCHDVIDIPPSEIEQPVRAHLQLWADSSPYRKNDAENWNEPRRQPYTVV